MTEDEEIEKQVEVLFERYFYGNMFIKSERRLPRKLKKRIRNKGCALTPTGLKVL